MKGDARGALALLQKARAAKPGFAPTWRTLGLVYEKLGDKTASKSAFQRYLTLVPNAPDAATIRQVELLEAAGADIMVSVNLMARETLARWPGDDVEPEEEPARKRYRMLDTLLEVMDLAQLDTSVRDAALADVTVTPRFGPGGWRDFELADRFWEAGRIAARRELPALRALAQGETH